MNWYKRAQNFNPIILWHATIPQYGEIIKEQAMIKPGISIEEETGQSQSGWNFYNPQIEYGEGIYLDPTKEGAIYYAQIRLKNIWDNIENMEELYDEEEYGFIGLFKIFIKDIKNLVDLSTGANKEFVYKGIISSQQNEKAWFEGPEWIDKTKELDIYRQNKEKIIEEINRKQK